LPVLVKGGLKFVLAWPFVFHAVNGVRHLIWDVGYGYVKPKANLVKVGWAVWGVSLAGGLGLAFLL
jgi:succinate dehydrogenase (ubiquinone) cytochrome b560 subunit